MLESGSAWDLDPEAALCGEGFPDRAAARLRHLQEWRASAVEPSLALANVRSVDGAEALDLVAPNRLEGLGPHADQFVTAPLRRRLDRLEPIAAGGWWCSGLDPLNDWAPMAWGTFKPDQPRVETREDGTERPIKYEHPRQTAGRSFWLRVPTETDADGSGGEFWRTWQATPELPLVVTEGAKKAGALLSLGVPALALPGIWNGCPKDAGGDHQLHPDLTPAMMNGRVVMVAFDHAEGRAAGHIRAASSTLARLLYQAGARTVRIGTPPGPEKGIDDYLAAGRKWSSIVDAMKTIEPPRAPKPTTAQVMVIIRQELHGAIEDGISAPDLTALIARLSREHDISPATIRTLADDLRTEDETAEGIAAEVAQVRDAAEFNLAGGSIQLDQFLPPRLAAAVRSVTACLPIDAPSALLCLLCGTSSMARLGTRVIAHRGASFEYGLNLFGGLVGVSGKKKSPTVGVLVKHPMAARIAELRDRHRAAILQWEMENTGKRRDQWTPRPPMAYALVTDFTSEGLAARLQTQEAEGLGLLIFREELAGLFNSLNKYRAGGKGDDAQQILELWDGGGLTSIRVSDDRYYGASAVSILGAIQPTILIKLILATDANDASGQWARFMFAPLPSWAVKITAEDFDNSLEKRILSDLYSGIANMDAASYELTQEARVRFLDYEFSKQKEAISATLSSHSSLHGKSAAKVLRVAGVLHLIQCSFDGVQDLAVGLDTINSAIRLVTHYDSYMLAMHSQKQNEGEGILRIVHNLSRRKKEAVSCRDVQLVLTASIRKQINRDQITRAMHHLAAEGWGSLSFSPRGAASYLAELDLP